MKARANIISVLLAAAVVIFTWVLTETTEAHNNAVIHPDITLRATALLASEFPDEYEEVMEHEGALLPATRLHNVIITSEGDLDNFENHDAYDAGPRDNIVSGVVLEDVPVTRVLEHFFHARSRVPLNGEFRNSADRAREFFHQSILMYGDSDQSRDQGYFHLGRATHHVEDMSSPAHVHNDPHLTIGPLAETETEDYEARWLPLGVWNSQLTAFNGYLNDATAVPELDEWKDVWGADGAPDGPGDVADLAGFIFDRATYLGTLDFPDDDPPTNVNGAGELAEMFPCDAVDRMENCLQHEDDIPSITFQWSIGSVGDFNYEAFFDGSFDEWWPVSENDLDAGTALPDGVQGEYYIEQTMPDGDPLWDFDSAVIPNNVRGNFNATWHSTANPTVANANDISNSIINRRAQNLLAPSAAYAAGLIKLWSDIVNPPPILRKIIVTQNDGGSDSVGYSAEWNDDDEVPLPRVPVIEIDALGLVVTQLIPVNDIPARQLNRSPELKHFDNVDDLKFRLDFSEPVDPFSINLTLDVGGVNYDMTTDTSGYSLLNEESSCFDDEGETVSGQCWTITVPVSFLATISDLNGKATLIVRAEDKDTHWDNVVDPNNEGNGKDLDGNPGTPARRQAPADELANLDYRFPWHTSMTVGRDQDDMNPGSNAYDYENGDRSHVLLFDTQAPTVNELELEF